MMLTRARAIQTGSLRTGSLRTGSLRTGSFRTGSFRTGSIHSVARAAMLGIATGGRSTSGVAALAFTAGRRDPSWLSHPLIRPLVAVAAAGELIGDKLPRTPSRLETTPLVARVVIGSLVGGLVAHRDGEAAALGVAVGGLGGLVGSWLGNRWRRVASDRLPGDLPGALTEDVVVAGLATLAVG